MFEQRDKENVNVGSDAWNHCWKKEDTLLIIFFFNFSGSKRRLIIQRKKKKKLQFLKKIHKFVAKKLFLEANFFAINFEHAYVTEQSDFLN